MRSILILLFSSSSLAFGQSYPSDCLDSLQIPEGFTPNGDTTDDCFYINFPCPPQKYELTLHNRWGQVVFNTKNYTDCWAGKTNEGNDAGDGAYYYILRYTFLGKERELMGYVYLIR